MNAPLALPCELTIYTVGELRPQWSAWLAATRQAGGADTSLDVDAAAVDEIDAAGVQLLVSLAHSVANAQLTLQLTNPSGPLAGACEALGVAHLLSATQTRGAGE